MSHSNIPSMARPRQPGNNKPPAKRRQPGAPKMDKLTVGLLAAFIVLAIAAGITAFVVVRNFFLSAPLNEGGSPIFQNSQQGSDLPEGYVPQGTQYVAPLQSAGGPTPIPWDGASRVNVLVMGLDYRDWQDNEGGPSRTDSMMLLTLDPVTYTAGMLSIPRDLWVNIPGFDYNKINTAYFLGEGSHLPGGGPGLAVKTVEQLLGVSINYYVQIDFNAFVKFIDTIGGVDINIPAEMDIAAIGGHLVHVYPGVQTLSGELALAYARNRYTEGGDFDRAGRQQQVIMAVRDNILNFYSLPTLISKAPEMYNELASGVNTNMSLQEAIALAWIVQKIPEANIKKAIIGVDQAPYGTGPNGESILIPIPDQIRIIRDSVFAVDVAIAPALVNADATTLMKDEAARVEMQNGTTVEGLAGKTAQYFTSEGLNITSQINADRTYSSSEIILYSGKPYTAEYLAEKMNIPSSRIYNQYNPDAGVDVVVIIGDDWAQSNPMP